MKILIVGAGAVGQVYGWHLRQAGHDISFFVKTKYQDEVAAGLNLYRLKHTGTRHHVWPQVQTLSALSEVAAESWDQVWLTLSSDALRGELATQLLGVVGQATVVCLQPDLEDGAYVKAHLPSPTQMVQGLITFISYQSPLPNQTGPEGIAYFLPPLSPGLFAGEHQRVHSVVQALKAGGISARITPDFAKAAAGAPALLQPLMLALEINDWQLSTLGSTHLPLGLLAAGEALDVAHTHSGADIRIMKKILIPRLWRIIIVLAKRVLPLDLEQMLHYHYSKVGVQSRLMLDTVIRLGQQHGLKTTSLQLLSTELAKRDNLKPLAK
jgi:Ketopantoate reductase PanE/ApbA